MPFSLLPSLLIQLFAVGYTPGPANLFALSCSLRYGKKASMVMWTGLVCGFLTAAFAVAVALHLLGSLMGSSIMWLKYIGAAYILYLAFKIATSHGSAGDPEKSCSFWNGFLVQLTNAKMILFDISAMSTFVLPYSDRFVDLIPICFLLLIAGPGANLVWLLAGTAMNRFISNNHRTVNIILGLMMAACAVYIAL